MPDYRIVDEQLVRHDPDNYTRLLELKRCGAPILSTELHPSYWIRCGGEDDGEWPLLVEAYPE